MKNGILFSLVALLFFDVSCGQTIDLSSGEQGWLFTTTDDSIRGKISVASDSKSLMVAQANALAHYRAGDVKGIHFADFEMIPAIVESDMEMRLFRVMAKGKMTLLFLKSASLQDSTAANYYILRETVAEPIMLNERQFFKIFNKANKVMWAYAYSHALDMTSEQDIQSLFDYFNKLNQ